MDLTNEKEVFKRVSEDGFSLSSLPIEKRTPELCEAAMKQNIYTIYLVPKHLRTPEYIKLFNKKSGREDLFKIEKVMFFGIGLQLIFGLLFINSSSEYKNYFFYLMLFSILTTLIMMGYMNRRKNKKMNEDEL